MAKIGFIGLGHMGNPMVKNLLKHGHEVKVFDVVEATVQDLVKEGAIGTKTISEVAQNVDALFTMLQTGEQVKNVCLQKNGVFENLSPKCLYLDSSSIDIKTTRFIHEKAKEKQIAMVDAPVSGGVVGAQNATLTFMVGGSEENFLIAKPFLELLGKRVIHAGPEGTGQAAKICNNMILGVSMIAVSEAFTLGKKLGLEPQKFFEISSNASGQCWSMTSYCPIPGILENVPSNNNYQPGFTSHMMLKDLRLSQDAALQTNSSTPLGAEATALYSLFVNNGAGDLDFSGIIKLIAGEVFNYKKQ